MAAAKKKTKKAVKKAVKKAPAKKIVKKVVKKAVKAKKVVKRVVKKAVKKAPAKKIVKKVAKKVVKKAAPVKVAPAMKPAAPASRPAMPAPVVTAPRIKAWHVVAAGDTPSTITQKYYGSTDPGSGRRSTRSTRPPSARTRTNCAPEWSFASRRPEPAGFTGRDRLAAVPGGGQMVSH